MTSTLEDFDFMAEPTEPLISLGKRDDEVGKPTSKMDNKKFAQAILDVFELLGGSKWLLSQANIDPKGFLAMLSKMIPKSIDADDLQGLTIMLIDQYVEGGDNKILNIETRSPAIPASAAPAAGGGPSELGQPTDQFPTTGTATSGNPIPKSEIDIIDIFK